MNAARPIEIVGGGLAGLSLGAALARARVPVTVREAHTYPRHRVCGEFIRGLDEATRDALQLTPLLADARPQHDAIWLDHGAPLQRHALRPPALAISRYELDARLAESFVRAGGTLVTGQRADIEPAEGRVLACGRSAAWSSAWLGLKVHALDFDTLADLEMHLGHRAYVGVCALPDNRANVCGLFRRRETVTAPREQLLAAYLRACGLHSLAERLAATEIDAGSCCAVAALPLRPRVARSGVCIGDALGMLPPFTGNGMARAFQSAALALGPLFAWTRGEIAWRDAERAIRSHQLRRFGLRFRLAGLLHPPLMSPRAQRWLVAAARARVVPFQFLQRALS